MMNYSFISPLRKPIFSPITKSWALCFLASGLIVVGIYFLLKFQTQSFINQSNNIDNEISNQATLKNELSDKLKYLNTQLDEIRLIQEENTALINAIENLFGLIPDQITINSIALTNNELTIKGITPSKELYIFLLESPLRAIFSESKVDFFVLPSGWYNFVSVSKIIKGNQQ
ncbi:hypothetical protein [Helicobacter brantae]|uniref:Pilus assembly protein PilN n=1 Tax=Helicobacter brantae TaxID=375927 RepID=A0A3D8J2R0_9HELI|nr:hypothetical protein [Helicobacter brantae]RDU71759.1 hypothetical protein CQA58_01590 [Helicobacter brantae]